MKSWLDLLQEACAATSQAKVSALIGINQSVISKALSGKYKADTTALEAAVRQHLGGAENWLTALRTEVERTNQVCAARRIGVSPATVSQVLSGSYAADTTRISRRVRGAILGEQVDCPVAMQMPLNVCQDIQDRKTFGNHIYLQAKMCCTGEGRWAKEGPCKHACQPVAKKAVAA